MAENKPLSDVLRQDYQHKIDQIETKIENSVRSHNISNKHHER